MRRTILSIVFVSAAFPALANDVDDCNGQANDRVVRGCTAIIEHGTASQIQLSIVYTKRGMAKARMRQWDAAMADLTEAIRQNPKNPEPLYQRGWTQMQKSDAAKTKNGLTQAIADLTAAIELNPTPRAHVDRGVVYSRLGDNESAIIDYTKAIEKAPNYALAYFNRAVSFANRNNFSAAFSDVNQSINIDPQNDKAFSNKALYLDKLGRFAEAVPALNEAIRLNPANAFAYFERGRMFAILGNLDEAIRDNTKSLELQPQANAYSNRGIDYVRKSMPESAIMDLDKAIDMDKNNGLSFYYRAIAHAMQNNFGRAESDIETAVNLRPMNAQTLYVRSIIRYALHKEDVGKDDYQEALRLDPKLQEVAVPETFPIQYFAQWPFVASQKH